MEAFDPFSILPDEQTNQGSPAPAAAQAPVVSIVPAIIPKSIMERGNNGNNMPPDVGAGLGEFLAKRREGRVSLFNSERAGTVVEGVEDGLTMVEIAKGLGITRSTIWTWLQLSPEFSDAVAQAREYQGHASADNAVDLLDNVDISGLDAKQNMAMLRKAEQRARIRMQLAECFNFRQYGKKQHNLNTNVNATISPVDLSKYS